MSLAGPQKIGSVSRRITGAVRIVIWVGLGLLAGLFLFESVVYRFVEPGRLGPSFWNKQIWYGAHAVLAVPALAFAPFQFSTRFRARWPRVHQWMGRAYVGSALIAALIAMWLGATNENLGGRMPLVLLSIMWLLFTGLAWRTAVRRDFVAHRLFMMRSFNCALAFVWIRLIALVPGDILYPFLEDAAMRSATREWITATVPILLLELWITWIPQFRGRRLR